MDNFIIKQLNLEEDMVQSVQRITHDNHIDYIITLACIPHLCPVCGNITTRIKDYKIRKLSSKIYISSDTDILYRQRRFKCQTCGHTFVEANLFGSNRGKVTLETQKRILEALKPYNSTFSSVAREYNLSVETVINIFDRHVQIKRKPLSEIICLDEFYFDRHSRYKYAFLIMNFENNLILDIVESRLTSSLSGYFFDIDYHERDRVRYIIIDMYDPYRKLAEIFFKNATVCVDPFHVMKNINEALDRRRKIVMSRYRDNKKSVEYQLLKRRYRLLLRNKDSIDMEHFYHDGILHYHTTENAVLEKILGIDPQLKKAYQLKEMYQQFNEPNPANIDLNVLSVKLDEIIREFANSGLKEFMEKAVTLSNWRKEILASFMWINGRRLSNGPIEGKNNYIKKILGNANGFKNFDRARNKIMYSQNKFETYSNNEILKPVKKKGIKRGPYKKSKV